MSAGTQIDGDRRAERLTRLIRHPFVRFLARRLAAAVLTLWVVSVFIFVATNVLPGNVAEVVLGHNATPARIQALNVRMGYDHPMIERYFNWIEGVFNGDFGNSAVAVALSQPQTSVSSTLVQPLVDSLILGSITAFLLVPLTLLLGALAGIYARRILDLAISAPALVLGGLPEFVTGTLLIFVFFGVLDWLPPTSGFSPGQSPLTNVGRLVLPVLTLLGVALGAGVRQVRVGMIETLHRDYVRFARLNGIPERRVLFRYALRNALAPSVQIIAQNIQYLFGGIIVVESIFDYPGIGQYIVNAVLARDTAKVEAAAIVIAALYTLINIAADFIVVLLVPKLRAPVA
jgi:peptide/nickel transport system permease protein